MARRIVRRLQGILRQYGAEVAFLTGELLLGRRGYFMPQMPYLVAATGGLVRVQPNALAQMRREIPPGTLAAVLPAALEAEEWPVVISNVHFDDGQVTGERTIHTTSLPYGAADSTEFDDVCALAPWVAVTVHRWLRADAAAPAEAHPFGAHDYLELLVMAHRAPEKRYDTTMATLRGLGLGVPPPDERPHAAWDQFRALLARAGPSTPPSVHELQVAWLARSLDDVVHWHASAPPADLMRLDVPTVRFRMRLWERREARRGAAAGRPPSEVVFTHGDYQVEKLVSREALAYEGHAMQHCVGSKLYAALVAHAGSEIYAFVRNGRSEATVEVRASSGHVGIGGRPRAAHRLLSQVRGPYNSAITDEALLDAVYAFCEEGPVLVPLGIPGMHEARYRATLRNMRNLSLADPRLALEILRTRGEAPPPPEGGYAIRATFPHQEPGEGAGR